ncbi:hypothetical protein [Catenulispora subtropica]|uniref:ATPase involved in chromosome partitioning-like protein n=1 Tax=Catenulispora subtropica TaxID=450798 RepID=A0ABN2TCV8_9ACTN
MSLIVLASDKGSPGVTTTAVALAGVWPRRAILAECDPSGGDLVYRTPAESGAPLNPNIGMLSLATTARHGLSAHQLEAHLQRMHGGLELVVGLATGDQSAGLAGLWTALGRAFDSLPDADVIADVGRVDATSPALDLLAGAALVVLVARTSAEQIAHVRDRALSLLQRVGGGTATAGGGLGVPIGVLLIVDPKQRARVTAQVDELLRNSGLPVKVIGTVADDPDGADLINGRGRGRLDRTLLIRSTREVALDLSRMYSAGSQGPAMPGQMPQPLSQPQPTPPPQSQQAPPPMQQMPPPQPQPAPGTAYAPPARPQQPTAAPRNPRPSRPTEPTVWPGEQPPAPRPPYDVNGPFPPGRQPPPSAHEGFTSVTLGGGPDPHHGVAAPPPGLTPVQHEQRDPRDPRPARGEIPPGPGGHRAGPPSPGGGR